MTYPATPDKIEYPEILIYIPHVKIQPATLISLMGYNYIPVETLGDYGYYEYFKKRWEEGKTFINLEQDIVPYPGALKELWDCPQDWCMYDIHVPCRWNLNLEDSNIGGYPLGCMKISSEMIKSTPKLWEKPIKWDEIERILIPGIFPVHQHRPGVVNANPAYLGKELS